VAEAMVWNSLAAPVKAGLTLLASVVIARGLGPEGYGSYSVLLALLAALGQYLDFGINRSLPRFLPEADARHGPAAVRALLRDVGVAKTAIVAISVPAVVLCARPLAQLLQLPRGGEAWIRLASVVFAVEVVRELGLRVVNSYFRQKISNLIETAMLAVHPAAAAAVLWLGGGIVGVLALTALEGALAALALGIVARRLVGPPSIPARPFDPRDATRRMIPHAATNYALLVTKGFAELSFVVFLLAWAGTAKEEIARFAIAYKIVGMSMNLLAIPLQSVQVPLLARVDADPRPDALVRAYGLLFKYLLLALSPGVALLVVLAPGLVSFLYGAEYAGAALPLRVLALLLALETLWNLSSNVLIVKAHYRALMALRAANIALAPFVVAAAISGNLAVVASVVGAGRALVAFAGYRIAASRYELAFPGLFAARVGLASVCLAAMAAVVAWGLREFSGAPLLAAGAGALAFLVAFRVLGGLDEEERRLLVHFPIPGIQRLQRWI
jgi:O-antigen/teichoic acid export membrane protein